MALTGAKGYIAAPEIIGLHTDLANKLFQGDWALRSSMHFVTLIMLQSKTLPFWREKKKDGELAGFWRAFPHPVLHPTERLLVRRPWKMKIKGIKKLLGITARESDIKPSLRFMMSFSFYGGSRGWKLKADMGSRFGGNLLYTTVHKSAPLISGIMLLLTRAILFFCFFFWKVITVQGSPTKHLWMSFLLWSGPLLCNSF